MLAPSAAVEWEDLSNLPTVVASPKKYYDTWCDTSHFFTYDSQVFLWAQNDQVFIASSKQTLFQSENCVCIQYKTEESSLWMIGVGTSMVA